MEQTLQILVFIETCLSVSNYSDENGTIILMKSLRIS
jgi:hypothetical protein